MILEEYTEAKSDVFFLLDVSGVGSRVKPQALLPLLQAVQWSLHVTGKEDS